MSEQEFTIESMPDAVFRPKYVSPVDLLAISATFGNDFDYKTNKELFKFCLEHIEVKAADKWVPVKTENRDVYMPLGIDKKIASLRELCDWYTINIIVKTFQQSAE